MPQPNSFRSYAWKFWEKAREEQKQIIEKSEQIKIDKFKLRYLNIKKFIYEKWIRWWPSSREIENRSREIIFYKDWEEINISLDKYGNIKITKNPKWVDKTIYRLVDPTKSINNLNKWNKLYSTLQYWPIDDIKSVDLDSWASVDRVYKNFEDQIDNYKTWKKIEKQKIQKQNLEKLEESDKFSEWDPDEFLEKNFQNFDINEDVV